MANNRFQQGRGVFVCECCGRRTRDSGQSVSSECCYECYELAGWQNAVWDNGFDAEIASARDQLVAAAVRKGSNEARIRKEFSDLWPIDHLDNTDGEE
jgi:tRNA G26 N,N-dimethylase Trm1